jgi:hypothetical protein
MQKDDVERRERELMMEMHEEYSYCFNDSSTCSTPANDSSAIVSSHKSSITFPPALSCTIGANLKEH